MAPSGPDRRAVDDADVEDLVQGDLQRKNYNVMQMNNRYKK